MWRCANQLNLAAWPDWSQFGLEKTLHKDGSNHKKFSAPCLLCRGISASSYPIKWVHWLYAFFSYYNFEMLGAHATHRSIGCMQLQRLEMLSFSLKKKLNEPQQKKPERLLPDAASSWEFEIVETKQCNVCSFTTVAFSRHGENL